MAKPNTQSQDSNVRAGFLDVPVKVTHISIRFNKRAREIWEGYLDSRAHHDNMEDRQRGYMNLPKLKREKMVLPEPDKDGWSKFALRDFLRIYGMYWSLSPYIFEGGMLRFHFDR